MNRFYSTSDFGCLKFNKRSLIMDWNTVEGNWKQLKGKLQETWGDLTDDELDVIAGKRDHLLGKIQAKYGIAKEEAEKQVDDFASKCNNC